MQEKKFVITKKNKKGEDGYKTFSVRIPAELLKKLEEFSKKSGRSRNDLINTFLEFAVSNSKVEEK